MRLFLGSFFLFLILGAVALTAVVRLESDDLPSTARLHAITPALKTRVLDRDGRLIGEFAREDRSFARLEEIPPRLVDAFLCVEDRRFWEHWGVDVAGVARATGRNLTSGRIRQGASTLTQQLARNLFLTHEQTVSRKIKEAVLALKIEQTYSKEEILELYLNQIYFGEGAYGVKAAARRIFGKDLKDLTVGEIALLAGLPRNPRDYSPRRHPDRARVRRDVVLTSMKECGLVTEPEFTAALAETVVAGTIPIEGTQAPYFVEMVRQFLDNRLGSSALYEEGLTVRTTLDLDLQHEAETALEQHLSRLEKDYRLRRTRAAYEKAVAEGGEAAPDYLQGAAIAVEASTGAILCMIGGRDFTESPFNRAVQALRQPGSAMKPFVYLGAIEHGYYPSYVVMDAPVSFEQPGQAPWTPQNYDREFRGPVTLRFALQKSLNIPTIRIQEEFGPADVVSLARAAGITSPLPAVRSIALGTGEVSLEELTYAYAVFANDGIRVEPWFITRVEDRTGNVIEEFRPQRREVLDADAVSLLDNMLASVVDHGTGYGARAEGFTLPAGGKTGTTDDYTDAWFVGFTPRIVTGVWVGYDEKRMIGRGITGTVGALPIWTKIMKAATKGDEPTPLELTDGVVQVDVCPDSGYPAGPNCPDPVPEFFLRGKVPKETCPVHEGRFDIRLRERRYPGSGG